MIGHTASPGSSPPRRHRAGAKVPSRRREPGPSYYKSYSQFKELSVAEIPIVEVETGALRQARQHRIGRFLKGPVLMRDIAVAAKLPGKALAVFVAVRHRADLTRSAAVTLPASLMRDMGVSKDAKARALNALEAAGLVRVERHAGKQPRISLTTRTQTHRRKL